MCTIAFYSCEKEDSLTSETIDIEIESNGGEYIFASNTIEVLNAPNEYNATITNNSIVGKYAGSTTANIQSNNTTYNCNITIKPSYTYYIDMAIYMGWSKDTIENLFGQSVLTSGSAYAYNPLSEYFSETFVGFIYEDNKVICAASYFSSYQSTSVIKHLQSRYAAFGISSSVAYYGNALNSDDVTMMVAYNYSNTSFTYVMYYEYSASASVVSATKSDSSCTINDYDSMLVELTDILK